VSVSFGDLELLVEWQEGHSAHKRPLSLVPKGSGTGKGGG